MRDMRDLQVTKSWLSRNSKTQLFGSCLAAEGLQNVTTLIRPDCRRDTLDGWLQSQAESLPTAETRVIAIGQESRPTQGIVYCFAFSTLVRCVPRFVPCSVC